MGGGDSYQDTVEVLGSREEAGSKGGGLSGSGEIAKVSSWAGDTAQVRSKSTTPTTQLSLSLSPVPLSVSLSLSPHL